MCIDIFLDLNLNLFSNNASMFMRTKSYKLKGV